MSERSTHSRSKFMSADEAVHLIKSGDRVYLHEAAMVPHELLDALVKRKDELRDVETISLHTEGPAPHVAPDLAGHIRHNALFVGANVREAVNEGRADYTPGLSVRYPEPVYRWGAAARCGPAPDLSPG